MSKCPICNTEFECGANNPEPCWCTKLPNIVPLNTDSCLCQACLKLKIKELESKNK